MGREDRYVAWDESAPRPPQNEQMEQTLIGSVLLWAEQFDSVVAELSTDTFGVQEHRVMWGAIEALCERGTPVDETTLREELERRGRLAAAGGEAYILRCIQETSTPERAVRYIPYLLDIAMRRQALGVAARLAKAAQDPDGKPLDVMSDGMKALRGSIPIVGNPLTWTDLARVVPEVEWTWEPWLPKGLLTILVGKAGCGKSALALTIARSVITDEPWPDGAPKSDDGLVVWAETEAAQAVNLDRARCWGLPLERLQIPSFRDVWGEGSLDRPEAWAMLERVAGWVGVRLVIVDSLRGAFQGDENSSECANLLVKLASLARDTNLPVLVVHHLRKKSMVDVATLDIDRIRGSSVIVQMARAIWAIDYPDPLATDRGRLQQLKNNLARFPEPLGFEITPAGVVFGDVPEEPREESQREKAADLILALLRPGPMRSTDVYAEGEGAGFSMVMMKRAKKALGVIAVREEGVWWWALPA